MGGGRRGPATKGQAKTHPLGRLRRKSRRGPSAKLVTRNQLVWRLSLGPLLLATAYLRISRPLLVGCSSGVSARLPTMEMRATERGAEVVKARRAVAAPVARRKRNDEDMFEVGSKKKGRDTVVRVVYRGWWWWRVVGGEW